MRRQFIQFLLLATLVLTVASAALAYDVKPFDRESLKVRDQVVLRSGETIEGTFVKLPDDKKSDVLFKTLDGDQLVLSRRLILKVQPADQSAKRYNDAIETIKDDAQSHWEMVIWCDEQPSGKARFKQQIRFHLNRIVLLSPNDSRARQRLGYDYIKDENRWVDEHQFWQGQGYTKKGSGWVPNLRVNAIEQSDQQKSQRTARNRQFKKWQRNLSRMNLAQATSELLDIADPALIPSVYEAYRKEKNPNNRNVYVEFFGSARPIHRLQIRGLAEAAVLANSERALDLLLQEDVDRGLPVQDLSGFLKSSNNATIQRAALALGQLEARPAILALADVLRTTHQVAPASNGVSTTFSNNGGGRQNFGTRGPVNRTFNNEEVLDALRKITGQDFGFSQQAYQQWYVENYTIKKLKARR